MSDWSGRRAQGLVALVLAEYGDLCHLCLERGADSADHVVPRSLGGDDSLENLRPAHRRCNSRRGARSIEWFRQRYAPHLLADLAAVNNVADFLEAAAGHPAPVPPSFFRPKQTGKPEMSPENRAFFTDRSRA